MDVDFYSEKESCSCCKGLIYDCSNNSDICNRLGICGCCYDDSYFEEHKNCSCCKGFIYECKDRSAICKKLGNCHCAIVLEEANPVTKHLYELAQIQQETGKN